MVRDDLHMRLTYVKVEKVQLQLLTHISRLYIVSGYSGCNEIRVRMIPVLSIERCYGTVA
jgi:hypothetical protein